MVLISKERRRMTTSAAVAVVAPRPTGPPCNFRHDCSHFRAACLKWSGRLDNNLEDQYAFKNKIGPKTKTGPAYLLLCGGAYSVWRGLEWGVKPARQAPIYLPPAPAHTTLITTGSRDTLTSTQQGEGGYCTSSPWSSAEEY
eukprot:scaffold2527_cov185-Skeletonema_menzelii.AAC.19